MSRFTAVAAALALVVSGIAIGALATFIVLQRPGGPGAPPPPGPPPPPFTRDMESQLDLSEQQWTQIQAILAESRRESDAIRHELRPRLERNLEETRARIGALLTPEQRVKFEALVREDRRRAERFFLEGPPTPPPGRRRPGPQHDEGPPR
jgi:Spy/CpxP family protein refolding chaperone